MLELFEAHHNLDNPAVAANMMGLQVLLFLLYFLVLLVKGVIFWIVEEMISIFPEITISFPSLKGCLCWLIDFVLNMQIPMLPGMVDGIGSQLMQRRQLYAEPMSKLRMLMISRMAKPEEVLIVEDENGNIVRETMKDNDVLVQYKVYRSYLLQIYEMYLCLILFCHDIFLFLLFKTNGCLIP